MTIGKFLLPLALFWISQCNNVCLHFSNLLGLVGVADGGWAWGGDEFDPAKAVKVSTKTNATFKHKIIYPELIPAILELLCVSTSVELQEQVSVACVLGMGGELFR